MQKPLIIPETDFTPSIYFNLEENKFEIKGISRPENVLTFYQELFEWLDNHENSIISSKEKAILNFNLTYFNTASAKYLSQLILKFKGLMNMGKPLEVNWYYQEMDDKILEDGEDLSFSTDMNFNYIPIDTD